ncbi:MAG: HAD family hydrolase [Phycisphaerae bacterium]|jgi:putative hydrolase of the HAD superfamily
MPSDRRLQVVVFDLDDTIYPEAQYVRSGYAAVARFLRERLGRAERFEEYLWDRFQAGTSRNALDTLNEQFHLGLDKAGIDELVTVYRNHRPTIAAFPGMVDLLELLRGRYRLAMLSDGFLPAQEYKIHALAIEPFFEYVLLTEKLGRDFWKPSPVPFRKLSEDMGVQADACLYVADNPTKDFLAPNQLGWRTLQALQPGQIHADLPAPPGGRPQCVVKSLDELAAALR